MADLFESYGLGFFRDNEDVMKGLIGYIAENGIPIPGYYGTPYLFFSAGNAEFWEGTEKDEENYLNISAFHTHCAGDDIWELTISEIQIYQNSLSRSERILMCNGMSEDCGLIPVDVINADVLPSFLKGEKIKLQVVAPCLKVNYFESEEDYADSFSADKRGRKWLLDNGSMMPIAFLSNHIVGNFEAEQNMKMIVIYHSWPL